MRARNLRRTLPFAFVLWITASISAAQQPAKHVRNLGQVSSFLYRGGEPSSVGIEELGAMGIKTIIDLRLRSASTYMEKQQVEKLGMKYIGFPLGELSAPTNTQVEQLLTLLIRHDSGPIFIHCRRGKDRTGMIIACYRIQHDHWTNAEAQAEANKYGMSHLERAMRSYISQFRALSLPAAAGLVTDSAGVPSTSPTARP
jgi:tyrosine-protein phosphatase SIW14